MTKKAKDICVRFGLNPSNHEALQALVAFAGQSPALEFGNYGDRVAYNQEARKIGKQWKEFVALVGEACSLGMPDERLTETDNGNGRLQWRKGRWNYTTGQYWTVEYRAAAVALLERAVRNHRRMTAETLHIELV